MKKLLYLVLTIIFSILFYQENQGLNVLIFDLIALGLLVGVKELNFKMFLEKFGVFTLLLSAIAIVWQNNNLAKIIHIINWIILIGIVNFRDIKSILSGFWLGFNAIIRSPWLSIKNMFTYTNSKGEKKVKKPIKFSLYLIPVLILVLFFILYRQANPVLDDYLSKAWQIISQPLKYLDFDYLPIFILGLLLTSPIIFRYQNVRLERAEEGFSDNLSRKRPFYKTFIKTLSLKNEVQAGVFLFLSLNILLALVNTVDIISVWINFNYEGQMLKDFVHKGTYILQFSILLSVIIVLYFFRKNINFYKENSKIKKLAKIWIAQNALLGISVLVRCYHYINHFGLAYKRIALIVFILLTIIGLWTIWQKVENKKSIFYLLRVNALSIITILTITALFNWDVLIARYNIRNYKKSFVHFNFIGNLSDKALYELNLSDELLKEIKFIQRSKFSFSSSDIYITPEDYQKKILQRKQDFVESWEKKSWLSWNYADDFCYEKLTSPK
jgi:hypothetical protein